MPPPPKPLFHPPLLPSSSPLGTTHSHLTTLHTSHTTGATTTRTTTLHGFPHSPLLHRHHHHHLSPQTLINTYGLSPFPLEYYLTSLATLPPPSPPKPTILSVGLTSTSTSSDDGDEIRTVLARIRDKGVHLPPRRVYLEINLSCPNLHLHQSQSQSHQPHRIQPQIPIADSPAALTALTTALLTHHAETFAAADDDNDDDVLPVGFKLPPYRTREALAQVVRAVRAGCEAVPEHRRGISFLTTTNTLGNSMYYHDQDGGDGDGGEGEPIIGGMSGGAIHSLSLSNVYHLRRLLDECGEWGRGVSIIGVGGVGDTAGFKRMRRMGASAVALATALLVEVEREGGVVGGELVGGDVGEDFVFKQGWDGGAMERAVETVFGGILKGVENP